MRQTIFIASLCSQGLFLIVLPAWLETSLFICYTIGLLVLLFSRPGGQEYTYNLQPFATIGFYFTENDV